MDKSQTRLPFLNKIMKKVVQKSQWAFATKQQTQNDMPHFRQTTHSIA